MKLFVILFSSLILFGCTNDKTSNNGTDPNVEIQLRNIKGDFNIFYGDDSFYSVEAQKLNAKGIQFIKKNEIREAEQSFISAYRKEPKNPTILNNLGTVYREIGTEKMAIRYFNDALTASDSTYFNAAYNLGVSYYNIQDYAKSERILNYVILKTTNSFRTTLAEFTLAKVFVSQHRCDKAKELYLKIEVALNKYSELDEKVKILQNNIANCTQHQ